MSDEGGSEDTGERLQPRRARAIRGRALHPSSDHAIHNDTPISKRVDFHSFRRAFATSLAEAGVNEQRAMMLTSHSDSKTHRLYVQETTAMAAIPEGAVPPMPVFDVEGIGTAVSKRPKRPKAAPKKFFSLQ
jgi:hypothetical protein